MFCTGRAADLTIGIEKKEKQNCRIYPSGVKSLLSLQNRSREIFLPVSEPVIFAEEIQGEAYIMNTENSSERVGSVDVLKFLLAIVIALLHCGNTFGDASAPFPMGGIAVELFFVISGCLMCMSAQRQSPFSRRRIGAETIRFLAKKIRDLLVPYCVMLIIYLVCRWITDGAAMLAHDGWSGVLSEFLICLPNLLFLSMSGILSDTKLIHITWYISAMLIAMLVIYPLLRRFGSAYRLIAAPAVSILLMGYMYHAAEGIYKGIYVYKSFMMQGLMRAFITIHLGCVAYEISRKLKKEALTVLSRTLLTAAVILLCLLTYFVMQFGNEEVCYTLTLLSPMLIGILFSGQILGNACFNHKVCYYLGKASMYLYLYHVCVQRILLTAEISVTYVQAALIMIAGSFAMFVVTDLMQKAVRHLMQKHHISLRKYFIREDSAS